MYRFSILGLMTLVVLMFTSLPQPTTAAVPGFTPGIDCADDWRDLAPRYPDGSPGAGNCVINSADLLVAIILIGENYGLNERLTPSGFVPGVNCVANPADVHPLKLDGTPGGNCVVNSGDVLVFMTKLSQSYGILPSLP